MGLGPRAWFLGRLDAFLTEEQRRSPPDVLGRYRLLVGATLFLLSMCGVLVLSAPFFERDRLARGLLGLGLVLAFALALGLLRWLGLRAASLVVCGVLVGGYMAATFAMPRPTVASHAAVMLVPALSVYLLGSRTGLVITALFSLNVSVLLPLYQSGFGTREPLFARPGVWAAGVLDSLILLLGWGLSALFRSARDEASATVSESERRLSALLESTEDPVCSLDLEGRVVTANSAARRLALSVFGKELRLGDPLEILSSPAQLEAWRSKLAHVLQGHSVRGEGTYPYSRGEGSLVLELSLHPIPGTAGRPVGVTVFGRDITERKAAEAQLSELYRSHMEVSRRAGMAEVATGVLHNVGNALNSVNVSAWLVVESLRRSRASQLVRAAELLREHEENLPAFLTDDSRGRQLPEYLSTGSRHVVQEHESLLEEMQALIQNVEHIRAVVSMQQEHARVGGLVEQVAVPQLLEDALRLHASSLERSGIRVRREYAEIPPVLLDRHKLLQIVVNLLNNARHALLESGREDKHLTLRVERAGEWLRIAVADNGVGIAPEHLPRLFSHGFTTKKDGHGFGLHSSALAAGEMNGRLSCDSGGRGQGATFIIELPLRGQEARE